MQGFPSNVSFPFNHQSFYLRWWEKTCIGHHKSLRIARWVSQHSPPSCTWCMRVHIPFIPSTYLHKFIQHKWKNRNSCMQHSLILWRPPSAKKSLRFPSSSATSRNNHQAKLHLADTVEEVDINELHSSMPQTKTTSASPSSLIWKITKSSSVGGRMGRETWERVSFALKAFEMTAHYSEATRW